MSGNATLSTASSPLFDFSSRRIFSLLGLLLIALGTGGIKPCVSSFGGDQFQLPQQKKQLETFFSVFYASINAGSLISTIVTPILRHDVQCFGNDTCFPLAFGVPGILMVIALILFLVGKPFYKCREPKENIIVEVAKVISHALIRKCRTKEKKDHWLDHADDKYDKNLISHTRAAIQVLVLFIPLPAFWSLSDQQGSRWTFQATHMDGSLGPYYIKPDQMQVINPFLILLFIPLFESIIYPVLNKCHLLRTPLQRMSTGGLLAASSFVISAFVEAKLQTTYPYLPPSGTGQLRIFNGLDCDVTLTSIIPEASGSISSLSALQVNVSLTGTSDFLLEFTTAASCSQFPKHAFSSSVSLQETQSVSMFLSSSSGDIVASQLPGFDLLEKPVTGHPQLRVLYNLYPCQSNLKLSLGKYSQTITLDENSTYTSLKPIMKIGNFRATLGDSEVPVNIELGSAGVYTLILQSNNTSPVGALVTLSSPNSIHMLWLVPQYVVITAGEIMFSITGLRFSYTQAPVSMKSLMSSAWLLTVSVGNLIVAIVLKSKVIDNQVWEFLFFATLMTIDMIIFIILASLYKYKSFADLETKDETNEEDDTESTPNL